MTVSELSGTHGLVRRAAFALLLCATATATATTPGITTAGHVLHRLGPVGMQGWGETDVDGDALLDLVTSANGPASLILVYGRRPDSSTIELKQGLPGPPGRISAIATSPANDSRVVSVLSDRTVTRFGGWPLAPVGSFAVTHDVILARIGDIDADGVLELLCAGQGMLSAYSLPEGALKWSMPMVVTDIALASFDADPALELVIAGGDGVVGRVLDGATRATEWSRAQGFGTYVSAGAFGLSHEQGFLGARDWSELTGFSVTPFDVAWNMTNFDTDGVASGDTDADGRDEFAVGDGQWGSIRVYDAPYLQMLYQMPNRGHGIWALGMLDFDADSRDEVWYSARIENSSNLDESFAAAIMNPITARPRLVIESRRQAATASLLADLDGNGRLDWAMGTSADLAYIGLLRILDSNSLREVWRAPNEPANSFLPFQMTYRSLHSAQLDGDPADELVVVGGAGYGDFRILVVDGATHEVERQIPEPIERWYATVTNARLVQHVEGGTPELLVASYRYAAAANVKLDVHALPSGERIWSSQTVAGPQDRSLGLDVGQLDSDPSSEYLLVHTSGLAAFDGSSGQLEWTLPTAVQGAVIVPSSAGSRVLVFTTNGEVTWYDPATLAATGGFSLPGPLETLVRLPDRNDVLLAVSDERVKLINLEGQVLAESDWIGSGPSLGDNLHVVRDGSGWLISVGRSFATFQLRLEDIVIFSSGFEHAFR